MNTGFSEYSSWRDETLFASLVYAKRELPMERRHFLKLAFGFAAGATAVAASAQAAPLSPLPLSGDGGLPPTNGEARPAVVSGDEVNRLKPEEVRWHGRHWGWRRRHWHRRHWRRRRW
jgi:hypothetical protein